MKVTSSKSITFPKLGWAISAGEVKELPNDKAAQERILSEPEIVEAGEKKADEKKSDKPINHDTN